VALIAGVEPDLDFVFDFAGPIVGFQHHRGITHSFVGGFGLALSAAVVLYTIFRYHTYWRLVGLLYLGTLLHIWMDYLTSYGTQIFLPFDAGRYTADAVFIIDYFYTGIIVTTLLLIRMVHGQRHEWYRTASVVCTIALTLWGHRYSCNTACCSWLCGLGLHLVLFTVLVALFTHIRRRWQADHAVVVGRCGVVALAAHGAASLSCCGHAALYHCAQITTR
jgi:membrane-bound metal-dependent hydrolase YbcI (DUF457 family)